MCPSVLVISYVYDLPFGRGQKYMSDASGVVGKVVSGWGVDGVTTFQKGFPLPISFGGSTPLSSAGFSQNFQLRPNFVPGCNKSTAHVTSSTGGIRLVQPDLLHSSRGLGHSATSRVWMPHSEAQGSITGTSRYTKRQISVRIIGSGFSSEPNFSTPSIASSLVPRTRRVAVIQLQITTELRSCEQPIEQSETHSVRIEVPVLAGKWNESGCRPPRHPLFSQQLKKVPSHLEQLQSTMPTVLILMTSSRSLITPGYITHRFKWCASSARLVLITANEKNQPTRLHPQTFSARPRRANLRRKASPRPGFHTSEFTDAARSI